MIRKNSDPVIVIMTISDLHAQLEPTYAWADDGTLQERGGISRIAAHLNKIKEECPDKVLLLGSGDFFVEDFNRGRYFTAFGGQMIAEFLNTLPIDASTIGNHEFDFGITAADRALLACSFPIIATNLKQSELTRHILKKLIIEKNGYKIGILGVMLSDMEKIWFMIEVDEPGQPPQFEPNLYDCMQAAVDELKNADHVDFVIVLSHIGIDEDRKLAEHVHGIDLICGGHTHALTKKGCEVVVQKTDNTKTVISHPGDRGTTLGIVKLWPKKDGILTYECDVLQVDASVHQDQQLEEKLQVYKKQLPHSRAVATSTCPIDTSKNALRKQENSFANFVTDVIRDYFDADIVLINASSIRNEEILPPGPITEKDMGNMFPFNNDFLIRLKASGHQIRQALELGASDLKGPSRNLLHAAGLRYTIDPARPAVIPLKNEEGMIMGSKQDGNMIISIEVEHNNLYTSVDDNREYDVIINNMMVDEFFYLAQFYMFKSIQDKHNTGLTAKDVLMKYFTDHPVISPNKVGRLIIQNQ